MSLLTTESISLDSTFNPLSKGFFLTNQRILSRAILKSWSCLAKQPHINCFVKGGYFGFYFMCILFNTAPSGRHFGDAGIEPRTDETLVLKVKRSNHLAGFRPHVQLPVTVPLTPDSSLTRNLSGNRRYS